MYKLDASDICLLLYLFIAKILPALVTHFVDKCFNIKIRLKSITVLNASIQNICVKFANYEIFIGEIAIRSKYFGGDYIKPLSIELEDVKIQQTFESDLETCPQKHQKQITSNENDTKPTLGWMREFCGKIINECLQYLPSVAMFILQIIGIRIKNISATLLNDERGPMATINVPNIELLFDGCFVKNNRMLFIALKLQYIRLKFLAYNKQNPSRKPHQACLAEVIVDCSLEMRIAYSGDCRLLLFEKLHVSISNTQITFHGGLFDIIEHSMLHTKHMRASSASVGEAIEMPVDKSNITNALTHIVKRVDTFAPDLLVIHLEQTEVKSLNKQNSYHYHLFLHRIEMKTKFQIPFSSRMKVANLRIQTPVHEVMHLKELIVDTKLSGNIMMTSIKLDTLNIVYNHGDIHGWVKKIILAGMKSNRREIILKAFSMLNQRMRELYASEFIQNIFNRVVINQQVYLQNITIILQLNDQISSFNVASLKVLLNQTDNLRNQRYVNYTMNLLFSNRQWIFDLIIDGPVCWYMASKYEYLKTQCNDAKKKTFVRGSAFYIANSTMRLCSHGEMFKLDAHVNTLRTEYSKKLTDFVVEAIKSLCEYQNLLRQLNGKKVEPVILYECDDDNSMNEKSITIEEILNNVELNVKLSDISCFFINRHDVCAFMNLSHFTSHDNFNYHLEALQVSIVDFAKCESVYDLSELSQTFVSTKMLKINLFATNDQPQIGIDFTEKLDCSWNAHFIRHLLSLARDFHRFKGRINDTLGVEQRLSPLLPRSIPVGFDIKKLRNISIKHSDMNVDKLILLINELSGENLFFYRYFNY